MPKFRFQLDPALRARIAAEKQAMAALAHVERERLELEEKLRVVQRTIEDLRQSQRVGLGLGSSDATAAAKQTGAQIVNVRSAGQEAAAIVKLQLRAQQLALQLSGAYARVERAREVLRKAAAERKSVELLREARLEEWKREQARIESAMLDDVSQSRTMNAGSAEAGDVEAGTVEVGIGGESEQAA